MGSYLKENGKSWRRGRDSNPRYGVNRTHDFQSCTFNRSVTSPLREIRHLASLPCSINGQTVQSVSSEHFLTDCPTDSPTYHSKISVAKSKSEFQKNTFGSVSTKTRRAMLTMTVMVGYIVTATLLNALLS